MLSSRHGRMGLIGVLTNLLLMGAGPGLVAGQEDAPRFARDVRPILSDACSRCHGPDASAREADLRLDTREGLFSRRDDGMLIVPGRPDASLLWQRLTHADRDVRMPPAAAERTLTPRELDVIRRWIAAGAAWEDHWAFLPPRRPPVPAVVWGAWPRTAIDAFLFTALTERGLTPRGEAEPATLVRRVTLDLTGLPPTREAVAAFVADPSPDRYERLVERLLASPRHGEHVAVDWLDAARYADTSGYQNDGPRQMWRWRDWVLAAYNANMPFDQFTEEQLAGDLMLADEERRTSGASVSGDAIVAQPRGYLPRDPRAVELLVATGFQRNHRGNAEGGIIPEEYLVEYVADRVDTAGAVWLGLTVGCARCHSHKYDPITQTDYYRLFAYFNQVPEHGRAVKEGNSPPYITAPTAGQWETLARLEAEVRAAEQAWNAIESELHALQRSWESRSEVSAEAEVSIADGLVLQYPQQRKDDTGSPAPVLRDGQARLVAGPAGAALLLDGDQYVDAGPVAKFGYFDAFSVAAWVRPEGNQTGGIVSRASDDAYEDGWTLQLVEGKIQVNLVKRWLDDAIRVETATPVAADAWSHVAMTYDGSRTAAGIHVYVNGQLQPLVVHYDFLNQSFANDEPLRLGATGTRRRLSGGLGDVRVYRRVLAASEIATLATPDSLAEIVALPVAGRTASQSGKLQQYYLATHAPQRFRDAAEQLRRARARLERFRREELPTVMVMVDQSPSRATAVLDRGAYDRPRETVTAQVPSALTASTGPVAGNRRDFARWLVHPQNPLTARVAVNNLWQRFFGAGLVKTSEDFGTQGEPPSHPALLDWLAVELVESGWNLRHVERLIVTSAAYRQSSEASPAEFEADPQNRWLARGPRLRLSAEMLRDQALALSGLLEERLGGPSIKPYQPAGLWQEIATDTDYEPSPLPDVFRRSLYCYTKRTVANPAFAVFDAPTREACTLRRARTNTPLQALTLLNDVTYVAAARALGEAAWESAGPQPDAVLTELFERVLFRAPEDAERQRLLSSWSLYRRQFADQPATARALLQVGLPKASALSESALAERAATALTASVLLNLDAVVTKE